jgi:hypothetical protein
MGFAAYFVGAITFTTSAPTAQQTIGWKFYLVFISCNVVSIVLIYFYLPETSSLSLEEVGDLFGDEVVVHLTQDGHGIVESDQVAKAGIIPGEKTDVENVEQVSKA